MAIRRLEQPGDAPEIHAVHAGSFPSLDEARLVEALRGAGRLTLSLVAEVEGVVVGHVGFSPVSTGGGAIGTGLAPVAVLPPHRRAGLAAGLIEDGLARSRAAGTGWAVVLGDPAYYARFGFQAAASYGLSDSYGGGAAFQAIELLPGALPRGAGLVRYAPEFDALAAAHP